MDSELMERAAAVRGKWAELLPRLTGQSKDRKGWICPICGHGAGGDGLTKNPKGKPGALKCFGCGFSGDIIDLYQQMGESSSFRDAVDKLGGFVGIAPAYREKASEPTPAKQDVPANDFTAYYAECRERIADSRAAAYLKSRGISMKTAMEYGLGFDPKADTAKSGHICPRIILPTCKSHYVARRIDGGEQAKKLNPKGSTPYLFNANALGKDEPVFVVEGIFDALSIAEAGGNAVATCSTSNIDRMLAAFRTKRPAALLLLAFDRDNAGENGGKKLSGGLDAMGIPYRVVDICGDAKDPNEALAKDKTLFLQAIGREIKLATTTRPDNTALYVDILMAADIQRFKSLETGYKNLDANGGGLYPGLYILAAISSLGKTTFALQMAEQIAANGQDVIFFSFEQSRFEMVSKGIARRTALADMGKAVTSLAIRKGYLPGNVLEAAEQYKADVGERLNIVEGNFSCNIAYIADYIRGYAARNGNLPVVFVDYLQILQPTETRQGTKETIDLALTELKRMSRAMSIPVVAISSINRANYITPVDFESLKESGGIEYTADVIWGLQLQILNDDIFKQIKASDTIKKRDMIRDAKKGNPRKVELVCLKNRFGVSSYSCFYDYYAAYDLYTETAGDIDFEMIPTGRRRV